MNKKKSVKKIKSRNIKNIKPINLNNYNFIFRNFLLAWDYLKESRKYIWFSCILFVIVTIIGYIFPIFFVSEVRKLVEELIRQTQGLDTFGLIRFIMLNNMQSAFFAVLLGIIFAIAPVIIIIANAYVLGFVANKTVSLEGVLVLWRLLPHGIFEIPAIMISVSLGIKLGLFLFIYHGKDKKKEFWKWIINSARAFLLIVIPLLVIAGIIEGLLIVLLG